MWSLEPLHLLGRRVCVILYFVQSCPIGARVAMNTTGSTDAPPRLPSRTSKCRCWPPNCTAGPSTPVAARTATADPTARHRQTSNGHPPRRPRAAPTRPDAPRQAAPQLRSTTRSNRPANTAPSRSGHEPTTRRPIAQAPGHGQRWAGRTDGGPDRPTGHRLAAVARHTSGQAPGVRPAGTD